MAVEIEVLRERVRTLEAVAARVDTLERQMKQYVLPTGLLNEARRLRT